MQDLCSFVLLTGAIVPGPEKQKTVQQYKDDYKRDDLKPYVAVGVPAAGTGDAGIQPLFPFITGCYGFQVFKVLQGFVRLFVGCIFHILLF